MKYFAHLFLFAVLCFGQTPTLITNSAVIKTHGGRPLIYGLGADKTDKILLDVKCNADFGSGCLVGSPYLASGQVFEPVSSVNGHQIWVLSSPKVGQLIVLANYGLAMGSDWWYEVKITDTEELQ